MNNRSMKIILSVVALLALAVILVSSVRYISLGKQLKDVEGRLSESRASWENTAAEKEEKQTELKALKDSYREAELSLEEAKERSVTLKEDIETLKQEIRDLETKLSQSDEQVP